MNVFAHGIGPGGMSLDWPYIGMILLAALAIGIVVFLVVRGKRS